jgi:hypothetical protein
MSDNRLIVALVMNIELNAFDSLFKIFQISSYFAITCKLISCQIGIMGAEAEIICQWGGFNQFGNQELYNFSQHPQVFSRRQNMSIVLLSQD